MEDKFTRNVWNIALLFTVYSYLNKVKEATGKCNDNNYCNDNN